jgi:hypothetical protein
MRAPLIALLITASMTAASWYSLGTWNGDGTKQTPSFMTTQREWRIRWTVKATDPKFANLTAFNGIVMDAKDDSPISTFSDSKDGESYVRAPSGRYYIRASGVNATWTVTAEEMRE